MRFSVPENEMPTKILILSDMEFNQATNHNSWHSFNSENKVWNPTVQQMIQEKYNNAGYKIPDIIYWNIQSRNDNFPVRFDQTGTALISGFSPSILKSVISGEQINPYEIMEKTINDPRYNVITI